MAFGAQEAVLVRILGDDSQLAATLKSANANVAGATKGWQRDFGAIAGSVGGVTAALGIATAAVGAFSLKALREAGSAEAAWARLGGVLENIGVPLASVRNEIDDTIDGITRLTRFSDDEATDALATLVRMTGDYDKALKLLPTALDLAVAKQVDATTAAEALGKAANGNTRLLKEMGFAGLEGASGIEALATRLRDLAIRDGATIEGRLSKMSNAFSELWESAGRGIDGAGGGTFIDKITASVYGLADAIDNKRGNILTFLAALMPGNTGALGASAGILMGNKGDGRNAVAQAEFDASRRPGGSTNGIAMLPSITAIGLTPETQRRRDAAAAARARMAGRYDDSLADIRMMAMFNPASPDFITGQFATPDPPAMIAARAKQEAELQQRGYDGRSYNAKIDFMNAKGGGFNKDAAIASSINGLAGFASGGGMQSLFGGAAGVASAFGGPAGMAAGAALGVIGGLLGDKDEKRMTRAHLAAIREAREDKVDITIVIPKGVPSPMDADWQEWLASATSETVGKNLGRLKFVEVG